MSARLSPGRTMRAPVPTEHAEQVALFQWWAQVRRAYGSPMMFAVPNGGDRHPAVAAKLRAEGVTPGIPDVMLAAPRGHYRGLFVELKRQRGGRTTAAQIAVHEALRGEGYQVVVAFGFEDARSTIVDYLGERRVA